MYSPVSPHIFPKHHYKVKQPQHILHPLCHVRLWGKLCNFLWISSAPTPLPSALRATTHCAGWRGRWSPARSPSLCDEFTLTDLERLAANPKYSDNHFHKTAVSVNEVMDKYFYSATCQDVKCLLAKWSIFNFSLIFLCFLKWHLASNRQQYILWNKHIHIFKYWDNPRYVL